MTILIDHLAVSIPSGTQEFGGATGVAIPAGVRNFTIRLARHTTLTPTFWPNTATTIDAKMLLSNDGGLTFPFTGGGMFAEGGTISAFGREITESSFTGTIDTALGSGWRAKANTIVTNGPLVSQLTIEVS